MELRTYMQSVVCAQVTRVFRLESKNYDRLFVRRNPRTVDLIKQGAEIKLHSRVSRLAEDQIPLYRLLAYKLRALNAPKQKKKERTQSSNSSLVDFTFPQRGPLIDMFGPGTVFYRNRMRERAKSKAQNKADNFRGATQLGFGLKPVQSLAPDAPKDAPLELPRMPGVLSPDSYFQQSAIECKKEQEVESERQLQSLPSAFVDFESSDRALQVEFPTTISQSKQYILVTCHEPILYATTVTR